MKRFYIILLFVIVVFRSHSQELKPPEIDLQLFIEKIFASQEQDVNYNDLYETLLQFYSNPIDLNKTNREELRNLFILNELQLSSFFDYINENG
ncbi:MAG: helix-hairpin-helix domain-containing protein, partial [Cyclobacteriaceae bacterium]|nr:helix-hairpin-helix domain-containing protein [Cyclobacteriaceae bacterium]